MLIVHIFSYVRIQGYTERVCLLHCVKKNQLYHFVDYIKFEYMNIYTNLLINMNNTCVSS